MRSACGFLTMYVLFLMEQRGEKKEYAPCVLDDPDDFYVVNNLKSDGEVLDYMHNCMNRYHFWAVEKGWPNSRPAKTLMWRTEVLKRILIERRLKVPDLYDQVFGYEPPVKRVKKANGLVQEVRAAAQELKNAHASTLKASGVHLYCDESLEADLPHETEDIDEEESSLTGFLGLINKH